MAVVGTVNFNKAYNAQDNWGGKFYGSPDYTGVASYVAGTGEKLSPQAFGCPERILFAIASGSEDGGYYGICYPSGTGYCDWYVRWYVATTGAEVANATDLSAKTIKIMAVGI